MKEKNLKIAEAKRKLWESPNSPYRTKEYHNKLSEATKKWQSEKGHPRGALGKRWKLPLEKRQFGKIRRWVGGTETYWHKKAREVYYQYRGKPTKCEVCNLEKRIYIHHKDCDYTHNEIENLIAVCAKCHHTILHDTIKALRQGHRKYYENGISEEHKEILSERMKNAWKSGKMRKNENI